MLFENTAELHLEQGSTVSIKGTVCLRSEPELLLIGNKISVINALVLMILFSAALFPPPEVHCTESSEGLDTDKVSQRAVAAHAFPPLAVPAQNSGELSLAFAVAAQCGVVGASAK